MSAVSFIRPEPTDTLESLGVQPGWYVRHAGCSIWFEVIEVFGQWAQCVARDPKKGTALGDDRENGKNRTLSVRPVRLRP